MRLYHRTIFHNICLSTIFIVYLTLTGCTPPQVTQGVITISITADGKEIQTQVSAGSTVQEALTEVEIALGELDRVAPPLYTVLSDGSTVQVIRVREEYYLEQVIVPYEHQELRNEALSIGQTILSQPGVNGLEEITYRRVYEDGVEISDSVVRRVILQEAIPEIVMVGSQTPFASMPISGRIAYLSAGNAWLMEDTTGNRRPIVTTGDLDGQIFSLSPDGNWLLFTRSTPDDGSINSLWAARIGSTQPSVVDIGVSNVVHFAAWDAGSTLVAYSTVEPRDIAPGWQANNDLHVVGVSPSGFTSPPRLEVEANSGVVYGWWGMDFAWASDSVRLAYARPDEVGMYDTRQDIFQPLMNISPLQTGGDWAWVPAISLAPDGDIIYTVNHVSTQGTSNPEMSPRFDLLAIPLYGGAPVSLVANVGMFAYPVPSPEQTVVISQSIEGQPLSVEHAYQVAYLQAMQPEQSEVSRYQLYVMDRDGSNQRMIFPAEGATGLDPQRVVWSPAPFNENGGYGVAVLYQGNIWLIDVISGLAQQITGDGLTARIDWK